MRFYFVRHGESEANAAGVIAGSRNSPLTSLGERQAEAAAALLAGCEVTRVFCSPLRRALDTAAPIARRCGVDVEVMEALRERSFGVLEGAAVGQIGDYFSTHPQGGESWAQFAARVAGGLERLPRHGTLAVIAHAGVYRVLLERLRGERSNTRAPNAGVFVVDDEATPPSRELGQRH